MSNLISLSAASKKYGRSHESLRLAAARGYLEAELVGNKWLATEEECERYVTETDPWLQWYLHHQERMKFASVSGEHYGQCQIDTRLDQYDLEDILRGIVCVI